MAKRWIWWPATHTTKSKVTQEDVTISEDKAHAFVTPSRMGARTASVIPAARCFLTKADAEAAKALVGIVGWAYKLDTDYWNKKLSGGEVKKVRYLPEIASSYYYAYPVDSKKPSEDVIHTRTIHKTKKAALHALAEDLRDKLDHVEADIAKYQRVQDYLNTAAAKVQAEGVKIPSTAQLKKRRNDRRLRKTTR
jgi:hypothetical protein